MVKNWSYLLYDNAKFWVPRLPYLSGKICDKLASMACTFKNSDEEEDNNTVEFNVAMFIDNTVYANCRPGGGPTVDGPNSPRQHPLIQQAFYNGWKSVHGIKWQTVSLPNGKCRKILKDF